MQWLLFLFRLGAEFTADLKEVAMRIISTKAAIACSQKIMTRRSIVNILKLTDPSHNLEIDPKSLRNNFLKVSIDDENKVL